MKYKKSIIIILLSSLMLSGCGKTEKTQDQTKKEFSVKTQTVSASRELKANIEFPAMVIPEEEAIVVAKTGGTAKDIKFKLGDKVSVGDLLVKIDDADKNDLSGKFNFNSTQITQAKLAVEQAYSGLTTANTNYQNLIFSNDKDLKQAELAMNQANKNETNTGNYSSENLKSAELAYESAKTVAEQARINLENRRKISGQSSEDTIDNSDSTVTTAADTCDSIITGINNIIGLDNFTNSSLPYKYNLGVKEENSLSRAQTEYLLTKNLNEKFKTTQFSDIHSKIDLASQLAQKTKTLTDSVKNVLLNTVTSNDLPQTSSLGVSLTSLQATVSGYQSQANSAITQVNGAKQGIENINLNNDSTLDALEKAYELALKQMESAAQNLNNLKVGNVSQNDQAGYGADSAANQYANLKIKLDTQLNIAKSQVDMARIQYQNALTNLNGLYDNHLVISPISGIITKKSVDNGTTISPGQILATVSRSEKIKIQFYIDQENLPFIKIGLPVFFSDNDNNKYSGKIISFTPQADSISKRFLVEAKPDEENKNIFTAGTIINISVPITKSVLKKEFIILPLSTIEIGQNGNFIMTITDGKAKKTPIEIIKVEGESAQIKVDLPDNAEIIIEGNKNVVDGDQVTINN